MHLARHQAKRGSSVGQRRARRAATRTAARWRDRRDVLGGARTRRGGGGLAPPLHAASLREGALGVGTRFDLGRRDWSASSFIVAGGDGAADAAGPLDRRRVRDRRRSVTALGRRPPAQVSSSRARTIRAHPESLYLGRLLILTGIRIAATSLGPQLDRPEFGYAIFFLYYPRLRSRGRLERITARPTGRIVTSADLFPSTEDFRGRAERWSISQMIRSQGAGRPRRRPAFVWLARHRRLIASPPAESQAAFRLRPAPRSCSAAPARRCRSAPRVRMSRNRVIPAARAAAGSAKAGLPPRTIAIGAAGEQTTGSPAADCRILSSAFALGEGAIVDLASAGSKSSRSRVSVAGSQRPSQSALPAIESRADLYETRARDRAATRQRRGQGGQVRQAGTAADPADQPLPVRTTARRRRGEGLRREGAVDRGRRLRHAPTTAISQPGSGCRRSRDARAAPPLADGRGARASGARRGRVKRRSSRG